MHWQIVCIMHKRPLQNALEKREGQSRKSARILDFLLFGFYQDRRCPCSCPQFVYAERNKGREQSVTQAVFVQTLTVRLSVSSAPLMSCVCPQSQARASLCRSLLPHIRHFFRIYEDPSAPAPWLLQPVDFVQSPGRAFCDPAPASPCFRTSGKGLAKGLRSFRLQGPQEIGLSLSFGFACRPPNAFAGIRTDIPTSYQTQYS